MKTNGVMEYWSGGVLGRRESGNLRSTFYVLRITRHSFSHHSTTPSPRYSAISYGTLN